MFEVRPTISPFRMEGISLRTASIVCNMLDYNPFTVNTKTEFMSSFNFNFRCYFQDIDLNSLNLVLVQLELCLTAYVAYCAKKLQTPKKLIEEIDTDSVELMPECVPSRFAMHVRIRENRIQNNISISSGVKVGTSPAMKTDGTTFVSKNTSLIGNKSNESCASSDVAMVGIPATTAAATALSLAPLTAQQSANMSLRKRTDTRLLTTTTSPQVAHILQSSLGRQIILSSPAPSCGSTTVLTQSGQRLTVLKSNPTSAQQRNGTAVNKPVMKVSPILNVQSMSTQPLTNALVQQLKTNSSSAVDRQSKLFLNINETQSEPNEFSLLDKEQQRKERRAQKLKFIARINGRRCDGTPIYGGDLRDTITNFFTSSLSSNDIMAEDNVPWFARSYMTCRQTMSERDNCSLSNAIKSFEQRTQELKAVFSNFVQFVPAVSAPEPYLHISHPQPSYSNMELRREKAIQVAVSQKLTLLHPIISAMSTQVKIYFAFEEYVALLISFNVNILLLILLHKCQNKFGNSPALGQS